MVNKLPASLSQSLVVKLLPNADCAGDVRVVTATCRPKTVMNASGEGGTEVMFTSVCSAIISSCLTIQLVKTRPECADVAFSSVYCFFIRYGC